MRYLVSLIVFSTLAFGYTIEFNKNFSKEIENDEVSSYISIYSKNETQKKAINGLSKYKRIMDRFKNIRKTDIKQNSYPEYRYEKASNKRVLDGYKAVLNYTISARDATSISEYIEKLLKIKRDEKSLQLSFSNLSYQVSKSTKEAVEEELRLEAILWAKNYTLKLADELKQSCEIKDIYIGSNRVASPIPVAYATLKKSSMETTADVSLPSPSDTKISINSTFRFECK